MSSFFPSHDGGLGGPSEGFASTGSAAMTVDGVVAALRSDAVAVCAGLADADGLVRVWDGPSERREPACSFVAAHHALPDVAPGAPVRRWLVEAGDEALVAQLLEDGRTLFVVIDARSTPGLARVRLLQAARRLGSDLEKP